MVWQNIQSFPTWRTGEYQNQMFIPMFQRSSKYTYCTMNKSNIHKKPMRWERTCLLSPNGKVKFLEFNFFFLKSRATTLPLALHEKKENAGSVPCSQLTKAKQKLCMEKF